LGGVVTTTNSAASYSAKCHRETNSDTPADNSLENRASLHRLHIGKLRMRTSLAVLFSAAFCNLANAQSFVETWANPSIGLALQCTEGSAPGALPIQPLVCSLPAGARFGTFNRSDSSGCVDPGPNACYARDASVSPVALNFHGLRFPIISKATFPRGGYISAEVELRAYCGPTGSENCFAGLTLINAEGNYREIAYLNGNGSPSTMQIHRYTPQRAGPLRDIGGNVITVPRDTYHRLRIDYYGHQGGKWVYFVDDVVRSVSVETGGSTQCNGEACQVEPSHAFNPIDTAVLEGDPHVALYLVGSDDPSKPDYVEGAIRPLTVYTGQHQDQAQLVQSDGFGVLSHAWIAQYVPMGGVNITMARLFLMPLTTYVVEARLNNGGIPGTLVNSVTYQTDRYGLQDVPLWVPNNYGGVWIVVKGISTTPATVGVTLPGQKPYAADYLTTTNSGTTWQAQPRNLTFATFVRQ